MRIYLAGSFKAQERLRDIRRRIEIIGHECASCWLDESKTAEIVQCAKRDISDISKSNLLILDMFDKHTSGGCEVEFGIGLALNYRMKLYVVGPKRNIFHELCDMHFDNWDDCLQYLRQLVLPF